MASTDIRTPYVPGQPASGLGIGNYLNRNPLVKLANMVLPLGTMANGVKNAVTSATDNLLPTPMNSGQPGIAAAPAVAQATQPAVQPVSATNNDGSMDVAAETAMGQRNLAAVKAGTIQPATNAAPKVGIAAQPANPNWQVQVDRGGVQTTATPNGEVDSSGAAVNTPNLKDGTPYSMPGLADSDKAAWVNSTGVSPADADRAWGAHVSTMQGRDIVGAYAAQHGMSIADATSRMDAENAQEEKANYKRNSEPVGGIANASPETQRMYALTAMFRDKNGNLDPAVKQQLAQQTIADSTSGRVQNAENGRNSATIDGGIARERMAQAGSDRRNDTSSAALSAQNLELRKKVMAGTATPAEMSLAGIKGAALTDSDISDSYDRYRIASMRDNPLAPIPSYQEYKQERTGGAATGQLPPGLVVGAPTKQADGIYQASGKTVTIKGGKVTGIQ